MINIKEFLPTGELFKEKLNNLTEGLNIEFNRYYDAIMHLNKNLLISTIDDEKYADIRLKECVPNIDDIRMQYLFDLTVSEKVSLLEHLWSLQTVSTVTDLENILSTYNVSATVVELNRSTFNLNINKANFELYQDSVKYLFDVEYTAGSNIDAIKLIIDTYKPANSHPIYTEI